MSYDLSLRVFLRESFSHAFEVLFLATSGILKASSMICEFLGIVLVKRVSVRALGCGER